MRRTGQSTRDTSELLPSPNERERWLSGPSAQEIEDTTTLVVRPMTCTTFLWTVWKRSIAHRGSMLTCAPLDSWELPQKQSAFFVTAKPAINLAFAMIQAVLPHDFTLIAHSMFHGILQPGSLHDEKLFHPIGLGFHRREASHKKLRKMLCKELLEVRKGRPACDAEASRQHTRSLPRTATGQRRFRLLPPILCRGPLPRSCIAHGAEHDCATHGTTRETRPAPINTALSRRTADLQTTIRWHPATTLRC